MAWSVVDAALPLDASRSWMAARRMALIVSLRFSISAASFFSAARSSAALANAASRLIDGSSFMARFDRRSSRVRMSSRCLSVRSSPVAFLMASMQSLAAMRHPFLIEQAAASFHALPYTVASFSAALAATGSLSAGRRLSR